LLLLHVQSNNNGKKNGEWQLEGAGTVSGA